MKKTREMRKLDKTGEASGANKADKADKAGKAGKARRSLAALVLTLGAATFPTWPGFSPAPASAQERTLGVVAKNRVEAILVGVDEYASQNVKTLTYAGADAKKLRDALTKIGVPEESVRLFVSRGGLRERPDKATIMAALDEAVKNSGTSSTILVALSGHGFETPDGEAAFCPEDAKISVSGGEVYVDKDSAILISDVAEKLRKANAKFKLLIVDACRAPAGARTTNGRRSFITGDASGLAFLQSCSSGESSWEDESVEGGLFTHYFVEGLTGAAADEEGGVSFLGVCDYAARRTEARARALRNASQTPFHRLSGVNFYLVEPSGTRSGGGKADVDAAFLARARQLREAAFSAAKRKDWATAVSKMEASLALVESQSSRDYLARYKKELGGSTDVAPPPKPVVVETDAAKAERLAEEALEAFEAEDWDKALRLAENSLKAAPSPEGVALKKEITDAMCVKALKMNTIIGAFMNAEDYMRERKSIGPTYYVTVLPRESYDLLDKAAKAGHGTAARVLALEYELDGNPAKARRYYRMAAESDDAKAREVARQKLIGE